jgi:hypothetical protein
MDDLSIYKEFAVRFTTMFIFTFIAATFFKKIENYKYFHVFRQWRIKRANQKITARMKRGEDCYYEELNTLIAYHPENTKTVRPSNESPLKIAIIVSLVSTIFLMLLKYLVSLGNATS